MAIHAKLVVTESGDSITLNPGTDVNLLADTRNILVGIDNVLGGPITSVLTGNVKVLGLAKATKVNKTTIALITVESEVELLASEIDGVNEMKLAMLEEGYITPIFLDSTTGRLTITTNAGGIVAWLVRNGSNKVDGVTGMITASTSVVARFTANGLTFQG